MKGEESRVESTGNINNSKFSNNRLCESADDFVYRFCAAFRRTFRRIDGGSRFKGDMDRHTDFYHVGRAMFEMAEYFGDTLGAEEGVYHGMDREVQFKAFIEHFNAPISTTNDQDVGMSWCAVTWSR